MNRWKRGAAVLAALVALVGGFEGLRTVAYPDQLANGIPTVCYGETRGVHLGDTYTVEECKTMLGDGLADFAAGVDRCLTAPAKIPDKSYVAFVSLAYNIGNGAFCRSTVARMANAGNIRAACDAILMWNKAGGKFVQGLANRRAEERTLCLEGIGR